MRVANRQDPIHILATTVVIHLCGPATEYFLGFEQVLAGGIEDRLALVVIFKKKRTNDTQQEGGQGDTHDMTAPGIQCPEYRQ